MLGLDWSELALIAVVALVVIGPKDLPNAIKGVARGIQSLRRKIGEFQQQADELVREAKLEDVRNQIADVRNTISEIRSFDLKGTIEKHVDGDGSVRKAFDDPLIPGGSTYSPPPAYEPPPVPANAPAFIPPDVARWAAPPPPPPPQPEPAPAPAFVPPGATAPVMATPLPAALPAEATPPLPAASVEPPRHSPSTPSV